MKFIKSAVCAGLAAGSLVANAQQDLYNNLSGSFDQIIWDTDGGGFSQGANYGTRVGQIITDVAGTTAITDIESIYRGASSTLFPSEVYVDVFNFSAGVVGTQLGSEQTAPIVSLKDYMVAGGDLSGSNAWDVGAAVNITGLVAGHQYLVAMQINSPDGVGAWQAYALDGKPNTYLQDFSNYGYAGPYGAPTWQEYGAFKSYSGLSGDSLMRVQGNTSNSTPEPAMASLLMAGASLVVRRRSRAKDRSTTASR
jgi:hypothetical protein